MTSCLEVRPCLTAFREERALPASVRGPVERSALAALAAAWAGELIRMSFWKDGSGWPLTGESSRVCQGFRGFVSVRCWKRAEDISTSGVNGVEAKVNFGSLRNPGRS